VLFLTASPHPASPRHGFTMALLGPNNALAWAHFRLRGGWARSLAWSAGILIALACVVAMSAYYNQRDLARTMFGWASGLLGLQGIVLVLYVPARISAVIRQDITTKMIESHRLMPMPAEHAVAGYIVGAAMQPLVFSAGVFLLGGATAAAAGVDLSRWCFAHAILLEFAAFVWVLAAWGAFSAKLGPALVAFPFVVPYLGAGGMLALLPGITALLSPLIGQSIFDLRNTGIELPGTYVVSFAGQVVIGLVFYLAAARKYRAPHQPGLDATLGICLLGGWVAISFLALRGWEDFRPRGWMPGGINLAAQLVATMGVSLVLALAPVAANAWQRVQWRRHQRLRDPAPMRRPMILPAVLLGAAMLVLVIPTAGNERFPADVYLRSGIVILITLLGFYFLFDWTYSASTKAGMIGFVWLVLTWAIPVVVSLVRYAMSASPDAEPLGTVATCSPIGALVVLWTRQPVGTTVGVCLMALINALPAGLWLTLYLRRRRHRQTPMLTSPAIT
jgi:hypothetical protein